MISNHNDLKTINIKKLIKIPKKDITFLWSINHYDGWRTGVGKYKDQPVYFQFVGDDYHGEHQPYIVLRLSDDDWHRLRGNQIVWEYYVGTHTRLNPDGSRPKDAKVHSYADVNYYYSLRRNHDVVFRKEDLLGWFERNEKDYPR